MSHKRQKWAVTITPGPDGTIDVKGTATNRKQREILNAILGEAAPALDEIAEAAFFWTARAR